MHSVPKKSGDGVNLSPNPDTKFHRAETHPQPGIARLARKLAVVSCSLSDIGQDGRSQRNHGILEYKDPYTLCATNGKLPSVSQSEKLTLKTPKPFTLLVLSFRSGTSSAAKKTSRCSRLGETNSHRRRKNDPNAIDCTKSNQGSIYALAVGK